MQHRWNVSVSEAARIQKELRSQIRSVPLKKAPRTIAGADVSHNRFSQELFAGVIVLSYPELELVEYSLAQGMVTFPYVPGYLSFREVPLLLKALGKLRKKPDVIMADGHGIAHPRRIGFAAHLGLLSGIPSFGCAKSRLWGEGKEPAKKRGSISSLRDVKTGELLGRYVRTREGVMPIIVSVGNCITLDEAVALALDTARGYRIPEPTRRAHDLVNAYRRGELV